MIINGRTKYIKKRQDSKSDNTIGLFITGKHFDFGLFATVIVILVLGLIMILSSSAPYALRTEGDSYYYFNKQLLFAGIGLVAMLLVSKIDYRIFNSRIAWLVYVFGIRSYELSARSGNWCSKE